MKIKDQAYCVFQGSPCVFNESMVNYLVDHHNAIRLTRSAYISMMKNRECVEFAVDPAKPGTERTVVFPLIDRQVDYGEEFVRDAEVTRLIKKRELSIPPLNLGMLWDIPEEPKFDLMKGVKHMLIQSNFRALDHEIRHGDYFHTQNHLDELKKCLNEWSGLVEIIQLALDNED